MPQKSPLSGPTVSKYPFTRKLFLSIVGVGVYSRNLAEHLESLLFNPVRPGPPPSGLQYEESPEYKWPAIERAPDRIASVRRFRDNIPAGHKPWYVAFDAYHQLHFLWRQSIHSARLAMPHAETELRDAAMAPTGSWPEQIGRLLSELAAVIADPDRDGPSPLTNSSDAPVRLRRLASELTHWENQLRTPANTVKIIPSRGNPLASSIRDPKLRRAVATVEEALLQVGTTSRMLADSFAEACRHHEHAGAPESRDWPAQAQALKRRIEQQLDAEEAAAKKAGAEYTRPTPHLSIWADRLEDLISCYREWVAALDAARAVAPTMARWTDAGESRAPERWTVGLLNDLDSLYSLIAPVTVGCDGRGLIRNGPIDWPPEFATLVRAIESKRRSMRRILASVNAPRSSPRASKKMRKKKPRTAKANRQAVKRKPREQPNDPIAQLEAKTPRLTKGNGTWVSCKVAAGIDGVRTRSLATYRSNGLKNTAKTLGQDRDGRVWRKQGGKGSWPWYLVRSLCRRRPEA